MFYRTIFVCFVGFVLVKLVKMDPLVITFNIQSKQSEGSPIITCDHSKEKLEQHLYTVNEDSNFEIVTKYSKTLSRINRIICQWGTGEKPALLSIRDTKGKIKHTFTASKNMGTTWKCAILAQLDPAVMQPVGHYKGHNYSAADCYMGIHVRQKVAPQTILVNNMKLPAVRTNLSQKDVDFIAEYQYADGDVVKVACVNFESNEKLTMEYNLAGTMSDNSTMNDLSSSKMIGFETKLYSAHNNSYMMCTHTEAHDYTKVMVKFIMRAEFNNIVLLKINEIPMRPFFDNPIDNRYRIDYKIKYGSNQRINVTCEVERTDVKLLVIDDDLFKSDGYKRSEYLSNKKSEMTFSLSSEETDIQLQCVAEYPNGTRAEQVLIHFTAGSFPIEHFPLHVDLPSKGRVMELYNDYKLNVIFYEFKDGDKLQLTCGQLYPVFYPGPAIYLGLDSAKCNIEGCSVSKSLSLTRKNENTKIACYIKEQSFPPTDLRKADIVYREIRVILRQRVPTTSTTTTITTTPYTALSTTYNINHTAANPASRKLTDGMSSVLLLGSSIGAVLVLLALTVAAFCFMRTKKTKHIETPYGDLSNKNDITTSLHPKENEKQFDLCRYSDHNIPEGVKNIDPKDHPYTEIDYSSCKPKICETQTRNSLVYDEPYVHITVHNGMKTLKHF